METQRALLRASAYAATRLSATASEPGAAPSRWKLGLLRTQIRKGLIAMTERDGSRKTSMTARRRPPCPRSGAADNRFAVETTRRRCDRRCRSHQGILSMRE